MKKIFIGLLTVSAISFTACNSGGNKSHEGHDINKDTTQPVQATEQKPVAEVTVTFPNLDAKAAASIKSIVDHYLHVKNGLANDNASEAASGAKSMEEALKTVDKSLFSPGQKKLFEDNAEDLKDHSAHISSKADDIKQQRLHFSMMSEDVYALAKAFGGGRPLYHDHCPMAKDGKGAMWLSETKEIRNPYFGAEMFTCGSVEEVIK